jgi:hypothetical protein
MLPRPRSQRPRLESSIEPRDPSARTVSAESDEPLSPEDENRRRAYAEWLARFASRNAAA